MNIAELFDKELFQQMVDEKMVTVRNHDGHPLLIANYSDAVQFRNYWNEVTLNCRGLIFDWDGEILARPWKKFFNLGDSKAPWIGFDDRVEVTDKMDGSLGILYMYDGKPSISTRGSFHSTQAGWATKHIRKIEGLDLRFAPHFTFLFEIIYPTNRIVVDYGRFEGLVLLGAVEVENGHAIGPNEAAALLNWPGLTTELMPHKSINDVLAASDRENTEGYVIRRGDDMVKWKRPDYINLHRLISNLSEKSVWSGLEGGKTPEQLCEDLPDEFHGFVKETSFKLKLAFQTRINEVQRTFGKVMYDLPVMPPSRKDFAWAVRDNPDKAYMFALLDDKDIAPMVWQELKPKGEPEVR